MTWVIWLHGAKRLNQRDTKKDRRGGGNKGGRADSCGYYGESFVSQAVGGGGVELQFFTKDRCTVENAYAMYKKKPFSREHNHDRVCANASGTHTCNLEALSRPTISALFTDTLYSHQPVHSS